MKASPDAQQALLTVQGIDNLITANRRSADAVRTQERSALLRQSLADLSPQLIHLSGLRDDLTSDLAKLDSDVKVVQSRLTRDAEQLSQTSSAKDAQGLEHEIQTLTARKENLESTELSLLERLEECERQLGECEETRARIATDLENVAAEAIEQLSLIDAEHEKLLFEKQTVFRSLPSELVDLYERQRERYGIGAAALSRGVSGGSGMALSAAEIEVIRSSPLDEVILCPTSNCILIRNDESGLW